MSEIDYGPLQGLAGTWRGDRGEDKSPEPDGIETNFYTETICFTAAGDLDNAETQELAAMHYHLEVHRIRDGKHIHDQSGYWIWDSAGQTVMHEFTIPRGVAVIAGGEYHGETDDQGNILIAVRAAQQDPDWQIIQAPFMRDNAVTKRFEQQLVIGAETLAYRQTSWVDIYTKKDFEHSDANQLQRLQS